MTQQTDSLNLIDYIKYPLITDKATRLLENNKYSFLVDRRADKTSIKIAIESFFKVSVVKVNTINLPRKKAIVTLSEGNKIDIFPDL